MKNIRVKRRKNGLFLRVVIFALMMVFLCACSGSGKGSADENGTMQDETEGMNPTDIRGQTVSYEDKVYELDGDLWTLMDARFWEGCLYYYKLDEETGCYGIERVQAEDGKREVFLSAEAFFEEGEQEDKRSLRCFDLTKDGGVLALVALYDEENEYGVDGVVKDWILMEFDAFGNLMKSVPLESGTISKDSFYPRIRVDGDGNVLLILTKQFILLDKAGNRLEEYPIEDGCFVKNCFRTSDGKLIFAISNTQGEYVAKRVNIDKKVLEELEGLPERMTGLGIVQKDAVGKGNAENSLLVYTGDALYRYQMAKMELTELTKWNESGIYGPQVFGAAMYGERILVLATQDGSKVELTALTPEENSMGQGQSAKEGPETITLGVLYKWSILDKMVSEYNHSQKKYKIVVRAYGELKSGTIDYQGPSERLMMDLLGEDAPDLLEISPYLNSYSSLGTSAQDLLEKGYVEDLGKYLDDSTVIGREDFEEKVLSACTFEKGLPAIPTSYGLQVFCTSRKDQGGRLGWSVADMMAYDRANPEIPLFANATSGMVFLYCVKQNMDAFVDWEKGEVHFDCPEFREILEYANSYPMDNGSDVVIPLYNDEGLLSMEIIDAILTVQTKPYMRYDGEGQFIGYPTMDGSPCTKLYIPGDAVSLGICAKSEKKEGAWDFIEYVLCHDFTNVDGGISTFGGIPTNKEVLSECWKQLRDDDENARIKQMGLSYQGGVTYYTHTFTQEEVDMFYRLVDSARVYEPRMDTIYRIVVEDLQPYFANQKSADQVIDLIESRVKLFLQENQ